MQTKDKEKAAQNDYERMKDKVLGELKNTFKPEFLNRIDAIIVFHCLRQEHVRADRGPHARARAHATDRAADRAARARRRQGLPGRRRATTRSTAPARCAGRSRTSSRIRWPRACCKASSAPATSSRLSSPTAR